MKRLSFILIELLIVVAIIGILAAIAVPNFLNARLKAKVAKAYSGIKALAMDHEIYALDNGGMYPTKRRSLSYGSRKRLLGRSRSQIGYNRSKGEGITDVLNHRVHGKRTDGTENGGETMRDTCPRYASGMAHQTWSVPRPYWPSHPAGLVPSAIDGCVQLPRGVWLNVCTTRFAGGKRSCRTTHDAVFCSTPG
ncbi:MAG: hypothetical protein ABIH23_12415 [bacterium]